MERVINTDNMRFYSPTEKALNAVKQDKATPQQWRAMLLKNGAKEAEMDWLGLNDFFSQDIATIFRQDIQNYLDLNKLEIKEIVKDGQEAKYSKYQFSGGDSYKELLLMLPFKSNKPSFEAWKGRRDFIGIPVKETTEEKYNEEIEWYDQRGTYNREELFHSSHFVEPNILAHIRFNERTVKGEKVLFIEEVQSDWAQSGKKHGFIGDKTKKINQEIEMLNSKLDIINSQLTSVILEAQSIGLPIGASSGEWNKFSLGLYKTQEIYQYEQILDKVKNNKDYDNIQASIAHIQERQIELGANRNSLIKDRDSLIKDIDRLKSKKREQDLYEVPNMPFKKTEHWVNLALRRAIIYAVENGFERIAWTNGQMQSERYDLSKQFQIQVEKGSNKKSWEYKLILTDNYSTDMVQIVSGEEELERFVGKDLANRIIDDKIPTYESKVYKGLELKVGGEGLKAFYDKIIPAQISKLTKNLDAHLEPIEIKNTEQTIFDAEIQELDFEDLSPKAMELTNKLEAAMGDYSDSYSIDDYAADMRNIGYIVDYDPLSGEIASLTKTFDIDKCITTETVLSIPITEKIKQQVTIGMPLFKDGHGQQCKEVDKQQIKDAIEEISEKLGVKVSVIDNAIPKDQARKAAAKGWYEPITDKIFIVLDNATSVEDVQKTIMHEAIGHKGLRSVLGESFEPTMIKVYDSLDPANKTKYMGSHGCKVTAAEEFLSDLAESNITTSLGKRALSYIKDALRSIGIPIKFTDDDLKNLLLKSKSTLELDRKNKYENIHIFSIKGGGYGISASINGQKVGPIKLSKEDVNNLNDKTNRVELASKYLDKEMQVSTKSNLKMKY